MIFIQDDATISDVIEEMYHAQQERSSMFSTFAFEIVRLKREIDAT